MKQCCKAGVERRIVDRELACHEHKLRVEDNVEESRGMD